MWGIAGLVAGCGAQVNPPSGAESSARAHPAVSVSPSHGSVGSPIHVVGLGFTPGRTLKVGLCSVDDQGQVEDPPSHCDTPGSVTVTPDGAGAFTVTYTIGDIPPATRPTYQVVARADPPDANDQAGAPFVTRS